jgi:hypothetical protein
MYFLACSFPNPESTVNKVLTLFDGKVQAKFFGDHTMRGEAQVNHGIQIYLTDLITYVTAILVTQV